MIGRCSRMQLGLVAIAVTLVACAGTNPRLFEPREPIATRIRPLEVHIADLDLLLGPNDVAPGAPAGSAQLRSDQAEEARYFVKKDLQRNVFASGAPAAGHLVMLLRRTAAMDQWWAVPTGFSLFMVNLFGFPLNAVTTVLDMDVAVLDERRIELAHYHVRGEGKGYIALYWGNTPSSTLQVSHANALAAAMKKLKQQLQADAARINARGT